MDKEMIEQQIQAFVTDNGLAWQDMAPGVRRKIMSYDENLMVVKVAFAAEAVGNLHNHRHTQITYIADGVFEVEIDGQKQLLSKGDVFHAQPWQMHGVVCREAGLLIDVFSPMREDFIQ
jgi:quercetin dioxygenase-like cupin family protein